MKKKYLFLVISCFAVLCLFGCNKKSKGYEVINADPLCTMCFYIQDGTMTSDGATFVLENKTEDTFSFGPEYEKKKKKNGVWESVEPLNLLTWNSILYTIESNKSTSFNINWKDGYGTLPSGHYRLVKEAYLYNEYNTDSFYYEVLYAEFIIK